MCSHPGCHGYGGPLCGLTNVCFIRCGNKQAPALPPLLSARFIRGLTLKDVEHNINKHYFGGTTDSWAQGDHLIDCRNNSSFHFQAALIGSDTCEVTGKMKDKHFRKDSSCSLLVSVRGCWVGNKNCCALLIGLCWLHTAEVGQRYGSAFHSYPNHILATSQHTRARAHIVRTFRLQTYNQ